ncbi:MAG: hypothetical protein Q9190_000429 [Brigantiaea leucoxantha]
MAKPKSLSLLDLFISPQEIRDWKGGYKLIRNRKPAAAAAPAGPEPGEPKPAEAPAVDAAKPEEAKPEEPKPEEAKTEEAKNEEPRAWTALEDAALLQLKAQKKSWKDIGEVITGREEHELRNRYKELKPGRDEDKGKKETGGEDGKGTGAGTNGQGGKGKKQGQKGQSNDSGDKNGGKGKEQGATEAGSGPVNAAKTGPVKKGILKKRSDGKIEIELADIPDEATTLENRPIIYTDPDDDLSMEDYTEFYNMLQGIEQRKWLKMTSRYFDMTGKRVDPGYLKDKMKNC